MEKKLLEDKLQALKALVESYDSLAVAFSGGVDSTFLLKFAADCKVDLLALTVRAPMFQPEEVTYAVDFCAEQGITHKILEIDEKKLKPFMHNPIDRCYICKKTIFTYILKELEAGSVNPEQGARNKSFVLADGTNADDCLDYRPGTKALAELGVASPLREVGLTKAEIREALKTMNSQIWDKPAFACLASRIPYGEPITVNKLTAINKLENFLQKRGFRQVRVRCHQGSHATLLARIEIAPTEMKNFLNAGMFKEVETAGKAAGFSYIALDLGGYSMGKLNQALQPQGTQLNNKGAGELRSNKAAQSKQALIKARKEMDMEDKSQSAQRTRRWETLKKLQNGSDIRGIALSGVEGEFPNLRAEETKALTLGFLLWLAKKIKTPPKDLIISVGRDPRLSGTTLMREVIDALVPYGVKVLDCGLASTPAMFMSTIFEEYGCHGAIMITASHLPYNRNGFKYFDKEGGLGRPDISQIIEYASPEADALDLALQEFQKNGRPGENNFESIFGRKTYKAEEVDLMETYSAHLRKLIIDGVAANGRTSGPLNEKPLTGLKIIVDAGNGGGGFFATKVLEPLGADIKDSQFLDPDGTFPNHPPNPENSEAMKSLSMSVLAKGADFGLIFDTDVDRSAAVDGRGREISRNGIVAMAASLIAEDHPGSTVVTDSITSDQLTVFLEKNLGLKHLRFKRGYKNVIDQAIILNHQGVDSQLAIETSGHGAFKENYFLDDGAYLATKIVIKAARLAAEGKGLDSILEDLEEPKEAREVRFSIFHPDFASYADEILEELPKWVAKQPVGIKAVVPNYEGVRISFSKDEGDGWCLLRKSLHDPILPLNIESNKEGGVKEIGEKLRPFLEGFSALDIRKL